MGIAIIVLHYPNPFPGTTMCSHCIHCIAVSFIFKGTEHTFLTNRLLRCLLLPVRLIRAREREKERSGMMWIDHGKVQ